MSLHPKKNTLTHLISIQPREFSRNRIQASEAIPCDICRNPNISAENIYINGVFSHVLFHCERNHFFTDFEAQELSISTH